MKKILFIIIAIFSFNITLGQKKILLYDKLNLKEAPIEIYENKNTITSLSLAYNKLQKLPSWMSGLINLEDINLALAFDPNIDYSNLFSPLKNLEKLKFIYIWGSEFEKSNIDVLYQIEELEYGGFNNYPEQISKLINLKKIRLYTSMKEFKELPNSFGNLKNLNNATIRALELEKIPNSIGNLVNLEYLDLSLTNLKLLPDSITQLRKLKSLNLSTTDIAKLPEKLGDLNNLIYLSISDTEIDNLPISITFLDKLGHLNISNTLISQLPENFGNLKLLRYLDLSNNKQLKSLPKSFSQLENINWLKLGRTGIEKFPEEIIMLPKLKTLDIYKEDLEKWNTTKKQLEDKLPNVNIRID